VVGIETCRSVDQFEAFSAAPLASLYNRLDPSLDLPTAGPVRTFATLLSRTQRRESGVPLVPNHVLTEAQLEKLLHLDSCTLANAIETFEVRLRNTGFTDSSVHCLFPDFPAVVGYAATARVRTSDPPMQGHSYFDRTDWWNYILSIPAPRIVVLEDIDAHPGLGALVGEVHANILSALGCACVVTNGSVRNPQAARGLGLQMFAGGVCVSHAYAHVFDFGASIAVGGMAVETGDLLHGDSHGVQTVPLAIADKLPDVADRITQQKQRLVALCHSPTFSLQRLRSAVKDT